MLAHINKLRSLHDQLKEMGASIDDKELAMTLLSSLPDEYRPLIIALDSVGEDNLSFEKAKGMFLNDYDRSCNSIQKSVKAHWLRDGDAGRTRITRKEVKTNLVMEMAKLRRFSEDFVITVVKEDISFINATRRSTRKEILKNVDPCKTNHSRTVLRTKMEIKFLARRHC